MSGLSEQEKIDIAYQKLKILAKCFSASLYIDPSDLKSIGNEIIARCLKSYDPHKSPNWEQFITICLRNRFRDHIRNKKNRLRLLRKKLPRVTVYMGQTEFESPIFRKVASTNFTGVSWQWRQISSGDKDLKCR